MAQKGKLIDHEHRISLVESRDAQELKVQLQLVGFDPALFLEPILNNTQLSDQPGTFYFLTSYMLICSFYLVSFI
jgi:hypothetical protein